MKSWLLTLAIVGATTSFAVHAFSADKGDSVFIDEGDGDFDQMPVPPKGTAKTSPSASQDATAEAPQTPETVPRPTAKTPKKTRGEKIAEVLKDAPSAKPGPAAVVPPAPAIETKEDQVAAQAASDSEEKAATKKTAAKAKVSQTVTEAPASAKATKGKKAAGVYVKTNDACPMTREPASESSRMITVKPAKKIWVEKVDGGKFYRAYNKAGEPGYIDSACVTVQ